MAALTGNVQNETRPRGGRYSYLVVNADTIYAGSLVGTDANGFLVPWNNLSTTRFAGIALETVTGDGSTVYCRVNTEGVIIRTTVAASNQAAVNSLVYCTTDNPADLVLSGATSLAIGTIQRFISGTTCEVLLFTPAEMEAKV